MIIILFSLILGASVWFIYHKLTYWQRKGIRTPGILNQLRQFWQPQPFVDVQNLQALGSIYGTYEQLDLNPTLVIAEPDLIRQILVKDFDKFPNHKPFRIGIPITDKNLFSLDGNEDWKRIRSLLTPTFTSGKLRGMESIVNETIEKFMTNMSQAADQRKVINIRTLYNSLSFDTIVQCCFGTKVDIVADPENPILKNFENLFSKRWQMILTMLLPSNVAKLLGVQEEAFRPFRFFENMSKKILEERKMAKAPNLNTTKKDFLQTMIDLNEGDDDLSKQKSLSDIEMMAQALIFLIGGFETTATAMTCTAYHLAKCPEVQEKLRSEVSALTSVTHDSVAELKYLDAVLKESLRLSPPGTRVSRQCVMRTKIGQIWIEPGNLVSIPSFAMQRNPKYFTNPEEFDPSRFLEGGQDVNHHPFAYLPFGGGPRTCIAQRFALMEVKMALVTVLRKFRFEATEETKLTYAPATFGVLNPEDVILRVVHI